MNEPGELAASATATAGAHPVGEATAPGRRRSWLGSERTRRARDRSTSRVALLDEWSWWLPPGMIGRPAKMSSADPCEHQSPSGSDSHAQRPAGRMSSRLDLIRRDRHGSRQMSSLVDRMRRIHPVCRQVSGWFDPSRNALGQGPTVSTSVRYGAPATWVAPLAGCRAAARSMTGRPVGSAIVDFCPGTAFGGRGRPRSARDRVTCAPPYAPSAGSMK